MKLLELEEEPIDTGGLRVFHHTGYIVYRAFDHTDRLLYVGMTKNLAGRMGGHSRDSQWWPQVFRITWEEWPGYLSACAAEMTAIWNEQPLHNVKGARPLTEEEQDKLRGDLLRSAAAVPRAGRGTYKRDDRFEKQVDPEGVLDPKERARRAEHARKAHSLGLALKSAQARSK